MPTRIRLQRTGRKKQASFRIVVTDKAEANSGPALETLGTYNPRTQPSLIKLNTASALNWLHEGARPTDTVVSIFKKTGVWERYRAGATADGIAEEEAVVKLGSDPKTSGRARAAAEGEKQAAQRRAEEKAMAEAAARKAAEEKAAAEKAAAAAAAAEAEAEAEAEAAEAEAAEDEAEAGAEAAEATTGGAEPDEGAAAGEEAAMEARQEEVDETVTTAEPTVEAEADLAVEAEQAEPEVAPGASAETEKGPAGADEVEDEEK